MSDQRCKPLQLSEGERAEVCRLHKSGSTVGYLAARFGVGDYVIRCVLDPALRDARNRAARWRKAGAKTAAGRRVVPDNNSSVDQDARTRAVQPPKVDTRDLTGRVCGDPLPGRSALDRRGDA